MIKRVVHILLICLPVFCLGQSRNDNYSFLGTTQKLPLKNAKVFSYNYERVCGASGLILKPSDDSVFSITNCVVTAVYNMGSEKAVVVKDTRNELFYTYTSLKMIYVTKGDTISKGSLLGLLVSDPHANDFVFMITNKKGMNLGVGKTWNILEQFNKTECAKDEKLYQ